MLKTGNFILWRFICSQFLTVVYLKMTKGKKKKKEKVAAVKQL